MDISVIIVSWNVEVLLKKCLTSIFEHTRDVAFEVIVVDNNSSDGSVAMVKHDFPGVRVIALDDNRGFAYANNAGMQAASGTHMLLLNPDTEFAENTLNKVFGRMEQDVRIGVLGCQLLNADRTIQPSVRRFPRARDVIVILLKLHKLFPSLLDRYLAKDFNYAPATPHSRHSTGQAYPLPKGEGTE
ncbi:MAG: glycosyltransferase family 2 protein, partial [Parcubacteria group bacterium]|nr:glycosyltransferase family 2 protein [Parcubacteria group bacterium]